MRVGDYVRTKHKGIFKIDERCYFNKDFKEFWFKAPCDKGNEWTTIAEVIKSSPNIMDLIEVGDYVNGFKVAEVLKDSCGYRGTDDYIYDCGDIKSIVTKEQMEEMEYKIND